MASQEEPRHNRIREALSRIYSDQPPQFREYLRRYKEDPKSRVFVPLAEAYRRQGRFEDALEICLKGMQFHPDYQSGRITLARCYMDKKEFTRAQTELQKVIERVPDNLLAQRLLGDCLLELKDMTGALHHYKMALVLAPEDVALAERVYTLEKQSGEPLFEKVEEWKEMAPEVEPIEVLEDGFGTSAEIVVAEVVEGGESRQAQAAQEAEIFTKEQAQIGVERVLGIDSDMGLEEPYRVEHISAIFDEEAKTEITTETLGDLYFSQGQFDKALRIFEKLKKHPPAQDLEQKIQDCRERLGVSPDELDRRKQIDLLRGVLGRLDSGI